MRTWTSGLGDMADGAFTQRASVSLELDEFERIFWLATRSNGVCAVVAGFTVYATVTSREAV